MPLNQVKVIPRMNSLCKSLRGLLITWHFLTLFIKVLCYVGGWREGWSVHQFTSLRCQLHHCKFGVFLKGECFIGTRSAKMECLQVWYRVWLCKTHGNSLLPCALQTSQLRSAQSCRAGWSRWSFLSFSGGSDGLCRDKNWVPKWRRGLARQASAGLWVGAVAVNWSQWD